MILDNSASKGAVLQDQKDSPTVTPPVTPSPSTCEIHVHVKGTDTPELEKENENIRKLTDFLAWKCRWLVCIQLLFFVPFLGYVTPSKVILEYNCTYFDSLYCGLHSIWLASFTYQCVTWNAQILSVTPNLLSCF
jgi:hypothetical protein